MQKQINELPSATNINSTDLLIIDSTLNSVDFTSKSISFSNFKSELFYSPTFTGYVTGISKTMVGLENVDNVSDANKPVSTAQATADLVVQNYSINRSNHIGTQSADTLTDGSINRLYSSAEKEKLATIAAGATVNSNDSILLNRANHTGTQSFSTMTIANSSRILGRVSSGSGAIEALTGTQVLSLLSTFGASQNGLVPASGGGTSNFLRADGTWAGVGTEYSTNLGYYVDSSTVTLTTSNGEGAQIPSATQTTAGVFSATDKVKLDGIAAGATVNSSDATLLNRTNHTGTPLTGGGLLIGRGFNGGTLNYSGKVAIVRYYNRTLQDFEVLQNYNAMRGRFGL